MSYFQSAFLPIAVYPDSEAPHWWIGAKLYLGFAIMAAFIFVGIWFALRWQDGKQAEEKTRGDVIEEEGSGELRARTVVRSEKDFQEKV